MFDELDRLRDNQRLFQLLTHYVQGNEPDREIWQDRLMKQEGARVEELTRLHGELLAHEWIEQNTGVLQDARPDAVPHCYRATAAGRRALKRAAAEQSEEAAQAA